MTPRLATDKALRPLTSEELNQILNDRLKVYLLSCLIYSAHPDDDHIPFLTEEAKDSYLLGLAVEVVRRLFYSAITKDIFLLKKEDWYHLAWVLLLGTTEDNPSTQAPDYDLYDLPMQPIDLLRDIFSLFSTGELSVLIQESIRKEAAKQSQLRETLNKELEKRNQENTNLKGERDRLTRERNGIQQEQIKLREELGKIKQQRDTLAQQNNELKQQSLRTTTTAREADPKGYYEILGIDPFLAQTLSEEKFKTLLTATYRAYSKVYHPDIGGNKNKMKQLNLAHEFLLDPQKRRTYGKRAA